MFTNSIFQKDPFFTRDPTFHTEMDRVDRLMGEYWHPRTWARPSPMMPSIAPPLNNENGRMTRYRQELNGIPMGRPRSHGDMFANMQDMFNEARTVRYSEPRRSAAYPSNVQSYSSSKIYTYSDDGVNEPKRYEAVSETTQGPDGIRQTLNRERNSVTGQDRMQAGRYIYDRGHVVEKTEDIGANEVNVNHDYYNLDATDSNDFHQEFTQKAPSTSLPRMVFSRNEGLGDRRLLKWQHGFSRNYDGTELEKNRRGTGEEQLLR